MLTTGALIAYLNSKGSSGTLSIKKLAIYFNVTAKTVYNYIKTIQVQYPGYLLVDRGQISISASIPAQEAACIPATYQERRAFILQNLLMTNSHLDLDHLAQQLCISEITLQNEIKLIRKSLTQHDLVLKTKNNQLFIFGKVEKKRALMIELIYAEAQNSLVSLSTLHDVFPVYDVEEIRRIILSKLQEKHFYIDEYSLINFLLHVLIAMSSTFAVPEDTHEKDVSDLMEYNHHFVTIVDGICASLEGLYQLKFPASSKKQFVLLLMTRAIKNRDPALKSAPMRSIGSETLKLVETIISSVEETFSINLNDDEFLIAFSLHIKNMLIRLRQNVKIHNPLLASIKSTSPMIYDIAVYVCNIISKQANVKIHDDEIAYIALHIGVRIEEINGKLGKLKTVLLCPQYYSYTHRQFEKLEQCFSDELTIDAIITNPWEAESLECDILISTLPLPAADNRVVISNFFNERDKNAVSTLVKQVKDAKFKEKTVTLLHKLVRRDLFALNASYASREEAIRTMAQRLIDGGDVGKRFIEKLLERENISPTNFEMIAIPHPIDYYSEKSVMEISVLKKPLPWGNTNVHIIAMFSVSRQDLSDFSDIFSFMARVFNVSENLEQLIAAKSYENFMELLWQLSAPSVE